MLARSGAHLIHMLAKQETPMKVSNTVLGRVPAKFKMRVIKMRSMFVLLSAEEMVKPPIRSMIVGENITEKTYLQIRGRNQYGEGRKRGTNLLCSFRRGHLDPLRVADNAQHDKQQLHKHGSDEQRNCLDARR